MHNVLSILKHFTSLAAAQRLCDRHFQINSNDRMPSSHEIDTWYSLKKINLPPRVSVMKVT